MKNYIKVIIIDYLNNGDGDMLYDIINDFDKWTIEHSYYDKRVEKMKYMKTWKIQRTLMTLTAKLTAEIGQMKAIIMKQMKATKKQKKNSNKQFIFCHNGNINIIIIFL